MVIKSHSLPLSAKIKAKAINISINILPKRTTNQSESLIPPRKTGTTSDAKNTAEKFTQISERALNFDLVSLNI